VTICGFNKYLQLIEEKKMTEEKKQYGWRKRGRKGKGREGENSAKSPFPSSTNVFLR